MKLKLHSKNAATLLTIVLIFVVVTYLITRMDIYLNQKTKVTDIISPITAIFGLYAIWFQMKRTKDIAEAEFIVNLNTNFITNAEIREIYLKLEESKNEPNNPFRDDDKAKIDSYLTFFETINNLLERNILKFDMIDDLFAYRFFVIVHNKHIQDIELIKNPQYNINIYCLHKKWTEYRMKKGSGIPFENHALNKRNKKYIEYANKNFVY